MRPKSPSQADLGDDWFESEQAYSSACAIELRRIRRRTAARPVLVLVLTALVTTAITFRVATKTPIVEAEIVIALSEEALAERRAQAPAVELREYVASVLMSDQRLLETIEKWNLYPLRHKLGPEYALTELRGQLEVAVWKNTFAFYDLDDTSARRSARIGITVMDTDPDRAYRLAYELASKVIAAHEDEQRKTATSLASQVAMMRDATTLELEKLTTEISFKQAAMARAKQERKHGLASALYVDLAALAERERLAEEQMRAIVQSRDALAAEIADAGLDVSMRIVEERRPRQPENDGFALLVVIVVVGTCSLLGMALVVGAFDPRVHDPEDIQRLGLPVLGHVP